MTNMRRLDVQGLRAVAILLVVGFHGDFGVHGGFTGVDVFFAVSGFVITSTLLRELVDGNRLDFLAFYARRIRRLLPALALMVAVVALVGLLATPIAAGRLAALTGVFASGFASNVYLALRPTGYFDLGTGLDPLLHTWTLGVEEQFYIIFPALLLLGWVIGRRFGGAARAGAFTVVAIACVVSGLLAIALEHGRIGGTRGQQYAFFLSPPRAWEFGAGALVALVVPTLTRLPAAVAWVLQALGLVGILAGGFLLTATSVSAPRLGLPVFGTCALIAAGTAVSGGVTRVLALRPFVWIGDLSYSWYLWHWPLIVFAVALWPGSGAAPRVAAIVSLLPAWLSYRYVENPIRYGFRRGIRPALGLAAVCVGVGVAASLVLLGGVHALDRTASVQSWQRSQEPHADEWRHCHADSVDAAEVRRCTWRVPHPRGLVALVGDSNAGQFAEAVLAADAQTHHDTLLLTAPCPYVDLVLHPLGPSADCLHAYRTTAAVLTRLHPALVIVASRSDQYVYQWGIGHPGQPLTRDAFERGQRDGRRASGADPARADRRLRGDPDPDGYVRDDRRALRGRRGAGSRGRGRKPCGRVGTRRVDAQRGGRDLRHPLLEHAGRDPHVPERGSPERRRRLAPDAAVRAHDRCAHARSRRQRRSRSVATTSTQIMNPSAEAKTSVPASRQCQAASRMPVPSTPTPPTSPA